MEAYVQDLVIGFDHNFVVKYLAKEVIGRKL